MRTRLLARATVAVAVALFVSGPATGLAQGYPPPQGSGGGGGGGGGASALDDLTDVTITSAGSGEYLRYSGSAWVDAALSIVDDTTPQLGGDLDAQSNALNNVDTVVVDEGGATTTPSANQVRVYAKADGLLYSKDDGGTEALVSGGSASPWHKFDALDGIAYPSTSTFATLETRNGHRMLAFDAGTEESVLFEGIMHENYAGGTITVELWTGASTATSGDAVWQVEWERMTTDLDSDSFASGKTVTITANGTSGILTAGTITFTQAEADGITGGEPFRLLVWRRGDDAADDMTGDGELYRLTARE